VVAGMRAVRPIPELARAFHETIAAMLVEGAHRVARSSSLNRVVLSGGCFANRLIMEGVTEGLGVCGHEVFVHQRVPTTDGGIAVGQAVVAGMGLIDHARKLAPEAVIIVITAFGEVQTAVEAMKKGAQDYLCKPIILDELVFKMKSSLARENLARQDRVLREEARRAHDLKGIIGQTPAMISLLDTIRRVAHTTSNVLITGESGTGKEVIARGVHYSGITQDKPFVAVNCWGAYRESRRKRAVRISERGVYRSRDRSDGVLRGGQRRNPLPR